MGRRAGTDPLPLPPAELQSCCLPATSRRWLAAVRSRRGELPVTPLCQQLRAAPLVALLPVNDLQEGEQRESSSVVLGTSKCNNLDIRAQRSHKLFKGNNSAMHQSQHSNARPETCSCPTAAPSELPGPLAPHRIAFSFTWHSFEQ